MKHTAYSAICALGLIVMLSACSPGAMPPDDAGQVRPATVPVNAPVSGKVRSEKIIGLQGLGDLRLGAPVPAGSSFAERGAQTSDSCRTITSPDYPGVYAIVTDGKVMRITVGSNSDVRLAEGIGVGASEAEVRSWFGGFREKPHKYQAAPAKYLTAPNAESGEPAVRFEIGSDGDVMLIHVGIMPVLAYVEGCA
ncbi:hypothetical protein [Martelella sp. FOR1707]